MREISYLYEDKNFILDRKNNNLKDGIVRTQSHRIIWMVAFNGNGNLLVELTLRTYVHAFYLLSTVPNWYVEAPMRGPMVKTD
jgi:hypothetical protein